VESARSSLQLHRASLKSTPHRAGPSEEQHSRQPSGSNVTGQLHEHSPGRLSTSELVQSLRSRSVLRTNPLGLGNIFTWVSSRIPIQTTPQPIQHTSIDISVTNWCNCINYQHRVMLRALNKYAVAKQCLCKCHERVIIALNAACASVYTQTT
jgi:hypothetical protein